MGKGKDIAKTAVGIVAGTIAYDALKASRTSNDPKEQLVTLVIGSVSAATAFHLLKDDVTNTARSVKEIGNPPKLLDHRQ